jgi:hypothetical protein
MPAVDQPVVEVDKMFASHLPTMTWSPAATLPSFIKLKQNNQLYKKRGQSKVIYSIYI